jgi:hypothetical protein
MFEPAGKKLSSAANSKTFTYTPSISVKLMNSPTAKPGL